MTVQASLMPGILRTSATFSSKEDFDMDCFGALAGMWIFTRTLTRVISCAVLSITHR
jgi:hypothetical protein